MATRSRIVLRCLVTDVLLPEILFLEDGRVKDYLSNSAKWTATDPVLAVETPEKNVGNNEPGRS